MATNFTDPNKNSLVPSRKLILLANDFPPIGGAGTQRPFYFSKYLSQMGWIPHIVTVKDVVFPVHDESLLPQLPNEVKIYRTESFELRRLLWWLRKLKALFKSDDSTRSTSKQVDSRALNPQLREVGRVFRKWFFVPDDRIFWAPFAIFKTLATAREHSIDIIFATVPCYSTAVIGYLSSLLTRLPLVIDLRDPWTDDPYSQPPTFVHRYINNLLEKVVLNRASKIIVISNEMKTRFLKKYSFPNEKITVITNGYDANDFLNIVPIDLNGKFVIGYVGSLYAHHLDSIAVFCKAYNELASGNPEFRNTSEMWVIGRCDPEIIEEFSKWPNIAIKVHGYQPHNESIRLLKSCPCLLLLIKNLDSLTNLVTIPGKLFEYVGSGNPIIMIGPSGDAADIVLNGSGAVHRESDTVGIKESITKYFVQYMSGDSVSLRSDDASRFDRRTLTESLVVELNQIINNNTRRSI